MNITLKLLIEKLILLNEKLEDNTRILAYKNDLSDDINNIVDIREEIVYNGKVISKDRYNDLSYYEKNKSIKAIVIDIF